MRVRAERAGWLVRPTGVTDIAEMVIISLAHERHRGGCERES